MKRLYLVKHKPVIFKLSASESGFVWSSEESGRKSGGEIRKRSRPIVTRAVRVGTVGSKNRNLHISNFGVFLHGNTLERKNNAQRIWPRITEATKQRVTSM